MVCVYVSDGMNACCVFIMYNTIHGRTLVSLTFAVPKEDYICGLGSGVTNSHFKPCSCNIRRSISTVANDQEYNYDIVT
jgi:hypothetical protein